MNPSLSRRQFLAASAAVAIAPVLLAAEPKPFSLNYVLGSALYGTMDLATILPEVRKLGMSSIDIWCLKHGNQREQIDEMGVARFAELLKKSDVTAGLFTQYPRGPFKLAEEMKLLKSLGGRMIVTGASGPKDVAGAEAKAGVTAFLEQMKPHAALAEEMGLKISLENHVGSLLSTPDSILAFADQNKSKSLGLAFAPHHLKDNVADMPRLIEALGPNLSFFYGQEHGHGSKEKLPKEEEMLQLPGFGGGLDYKPLLAALKKIGFAGPTEIFMHPVPRGVPILPTAGEITAAIARSKKYLESCLP